MKSNGGTKNSHNFESFEETPLLIAVLTYLAYAILIVIGHMRDFLRRWNFEKVPVAAEPVKEASNS